MNNKKNPGILNQYVSNSSGIFKQPFLMIFFLLLIFKEAEAKEKILFTCTVPAKSSIFKVIETRYRRAFETLGYDFELVEAANGKRSLADAMSGIYDGDCGRTDELNEWVPNSHLIRVNVKLITSYLGAWTADSNLKINSVEDLKTKQLRIGTLKGILSSDNFIAENKLIAAVELNNFNSGIKLLHAGRLDVFIGSNDGMKSQLAQNKITSGIYLAGNLKAYNIYPYLHEKRKALVPLFEAELKKAFPQKNTESVHRPVAN